MGEERNEHRVLVAGLEERDHLEDLRTDEKTILKNENVEAQTALI
jgi:hypothetical protein